MTVVTVTQDQEQDATDNFVEMLLIEFTIPNKPGRFTVTVPASGDPVAAAKAAIDAKTATVEGIYGL